MSSEKKTDGLNQGYIAVFRKILDWDWYHDINTYRLFTHLLYTVNWKPARWKGIVVPRGARVVTYDTLSRETDLSLQNVRTAMKHLESTGEVTRKVTGKYHLITVEKYDFYQNAQRETNTETNTELTSNQHGANTELTPIKESNKEIINNNNNYILQQPQVYKSVVEMLTDDEFNRLDSKVEDILELVDYIDDTKDVNTITHPYQYCLATAKARGGLKNGY